MMKSMRPLRTIADIQAGGIINSLLISLQRFGVRGQGGTGVGQGWDRGGTGVGQCEGGPRGHLDGKGSEEDRRGLGVSGNLYEISGWLGLG
eukprot:1192601-Amorphochlora_amoeboformis.AAC.1